MLTPQLPGYKLSPAAPADALEWGKFEALAEFKAHTSSTIQSSADLLPRIEQSLSADPSAPVYFVVRESDTGHLVATAGFHSVSPLNRSA